jgi:hypothetical protein
MLCVALFVLNKRNCHSFNPMGVKGEGPGITETRPANAFHAIDCDIAGDIEVSVGDYKVEVLGQENVLRVLKTEVENGVLRIYFDDSVSYSDEMKIRVSAPTFDAFSLGGSGEIRTSGNIQSEQMQISISGAGGVFLTQGNFGKLVCDISGSGTVEMNGNADMGEFSISGSGNIVAPKMNFNHIKADISGSGDIETHVNTSLNASISGAGNVVYSGSPQVETSISGSGEVTQSTAQAPVQ